MSENMALLSQEEIDTLLRFLFAKKSDVNSEVLDQESIDKLIYLIRSNRVQKLQYDSMLPRMQGSSGTAILVLDGEDNIGSQQKNCILKCERDESTGYISIICENKESKARYKLTPTCLNQVKYYDNDDSEWGLAIPPLTFDKIAGLLQVNYSKETMDFVCDTFAAAMYNGSKDVIPSIYMPLANDLIHHMCG